MGIKLVGIVMLTLYVLLTTVKLAQATEVDWKAELQKQVVTRQFESGVYVAHMTKNERFEHNASKQFPSASLIKLFILYHLFAEDGGKGELLNKTIVFDHAKAVDGGILHKISSGAMFRLEDLAILMLAVSDNTATNLLIDELGIEAINDTIRQLDAGRTILGRKMLDFEARKAGRDNYTSATDVARVLEAILKYPRMLEILSVQKSISKLPGNLPIEDPDDFETILAHKTGELSGIEHDAGIFFYSTHPVITIVLTSGLQSRQAGWDFCSTIGRIVYDTFAPPSSP